MQDKLYKFDVLTFEQIACAVLDIESSQENAASFFGYISQLSNAADSGELRGATKAPEWQPPPLMAGIQNNKSPKMEYNSRSKVPKPEIIEYLNARGEEVPRCFIDGIVSSKLSEEVSEQVADLKAENLKLSNELNSIKARLHSSSNVEKLEASSQVTFGGVCVLLAKYGVKNGEPAFNSPGYSLESPKANASAISKEIGELASQMVDVKTSDAGDADKGFKDSIRRTAISEAFLKFEGYISEAVVCFTKNVTENTHKK